MLTSIALSHLRGRFIPVDAGANGFIHRYWSVFDELEYTDRKTALVHFPGDKEYFANVNLNAESIENLMKNYRTYRLKCRIKGLVKKILDKQWYMKL